MVNVIASGSKGNCVVLFDSILVDIGVAYKLIKPYTMQIKIVTWSHKHSDHLNKSTLKKILFERPSIRVAVCEHEYNNAVECGAKNIDILEHGKWYDYGIYQIATFKTYHDVESNGWRFQNANHKIFFVTDTAHLKGISAKNYTHYLIEHNYPEEETKALIQRKMQAGEFCHQIGSINSHLSVEQAQEFYLANKGEHSQLIRLHETKTIY